MFTVKKRNRSKLQITSVQDSCEHYQFYAIKCHMTIVTLICLMNVRVNFGGGRVVHMRSIVNIPGEAVHFGTKNMN